MAHCREQERKQELGSWDSRTFYWRGVVVGGDTGDASTAKRGPQGTAVLFGTDRR
jgi:hypothetical protein